MFLNSKPRHRPSISVYIPSINYRHCRLLSFAHVGNMMGVCHSKCNSKKIYIIWLTIVFYMIAAYVAYTVYFDGKPGGKKERDGGTMRLQNTISGTIKEKRDFSTFSTDEQQLFKGNVKRKRILFWTEFYKESSLDSLCIRPDSLSSCPFSQCEFTLDKELLTSSDAVIFHGRDLWGSKKLDGYPDTYIDMPKFRSESQLWIFLMFEAPVHTWINLEPFDNLFNMTMTYRPDSDIYIPYGRVTPKEDNAKGNSKTKPKTKMKTRNDKRVDENNFLTLTTVPIIRATDATNNYSTKHLENRKLVAWSVSNCYKSPSRRNEVVHELHKYIPIDIYGDCGSLNCTPKKDLCDSGLECHRYLAEKYKFYLAFENSLCEDYITEKFYDSLYVGMVPVVYGYGDYSRVAPKGSYIDASVFPTMKSLANYLLYLDQHPSEYLKYFNWRKSYTIKVSYFEQAWCSLCTKLWTSGLDSNSNSNSNPNPNPNTVSDFQAETKTTFDYEYNSQVKESARYIVKNLSDWWFHKSSAGMSDNGIRSVVDPSTGGKSNSFGFQSHIKQEIRDTVQLKENACMNPTQLKWDPNIFSFYGFIYYPNYSVKMGILYAILIIGIILIIYVLRVANVSKRMSKMY